MRRVPFVREIAGWGGAAMITIALVMLSPSKVFPGWWALLPTLGTVLIIMAGMVAAFNRHVLAWRPFVFIGLISYPLYLWHWPLLSFAWQAFFNDPPRWVSDVLVGLSFLLAWLTYKLLERPIRMSRIARPAVALVMVAVVIGGVGYAIDLGGGLPWRAANATGYVRSDFDFDGRARPPATVRFLPICASPYPAFLRASPSSATVMPRCCIRTWSVPCRAATSRFWQPAPFPWSG